MAATTSFSLSCFVSIPMSTRVYTYGRAIAESTGEISFVRVLKIPPERTRSDPPVPSSTRVTGAWTATSACIEARCTVKIRAGSQREVCAAAALWQTGLSLRWSHRSGDDEENTDTRRRRHYIVVASAVDASGATRLTTHKLNGFVSGKKVNNYCSNTLEGRI